MGGEPSSLLLPARLRDTAELIQGRGYGYIGPDPRQLLREAADAIERLEAESATLADALNAATMALADVGAEL